VKSNGSIFGRLAAILLLLGTAPEAVRAENWPQFRGPRGDGTSLEKGVPIRWSATEGVRWRTAIPGEGHSSPVVWGRALLVTTAVKETGERSVLRLDAETGAVVWRKAVIAASRESMHRENSSASSTLATDGTHLITSFQVGDRVDLRCLDLDGKELWSIQPLQFEGQHGYSYSPIFHGDLVLFDCRQEGEAAVLALDKKTGKTRWRAEPGKRRISHVTPLIVSEGGREQMVVAGSDEIRSYDPASGRPLWWCRGLSDVAVAGLCHGNGMVFATAGYPTKTRMAVRTSGNGEVTGSEVAWSHRRQVSYVPSPVYHQGHLYTVIDDGFLYCFDARTGEPAWDHRLTGRFRASLVLADGRIHATNDQGVTTVFEANPAAFRPVATNELGAFCYTTPAISGGRLYLRTGEQVLCVGEK
jgi:hypothetical protein